MTVARTKLWPRSGSATRLAKPFSRDRARQPTWLGLLDSARRSECAQRRAKHLVDRQSTIDRQDLASDVGGGIRRQEHHGIRNLPTCAGTAKRHDGVNDLLVR